MKGKLFVAALATMAMAACTQDDLQSVSQSGQVSPIQFTVTPDVDALTKAEFIDGYTLGWEEGDLMSLFHGLGTIGDEGLTSFNPNYTNNAVYKAAAGGIEEGLTFTTHSMVKPGPAIMVYPADTTFQYSGDELYVTIPAEQSEENILGRIPFMSELLTIPEYSAYDPANEENPGTTTAGYGRDYPIQLKQVATIFSLNTNYGVTDAYGIVQDLVDNEEIAPIDINYVTITSSNKFNIKAQVKYSAKGDDPEQGANWIETTEDGFAWSYVSSVAKAATADGDEVKQEESLTTTFIRDVVDNRGTVEFILLPQDAKMEKTEIEALTGSVTVNTYYGEVTYNGTSQIENKNIFWKENDEDWEYAENGLNIAEGLNEVMGYTTKTKNGSTSSFYNEPVGVHVTRTLNVDLYDLDMSKVHIKTDKQLRDILKVYEALNFDAKYNASNKLQLTIDGDKETGEFRMSVEAVKTLQSEGFEDIEIVPCQTDNERCSSIVLFSEEQEENAIPTVYFVTKNAVEIVLDIDNVWTWGNGTKFTYVKSIVNRGTLNLVDGNEVTDGDNNGTNPAVRNEGTINVTGLVKQQTNLTNFGTINIDGEFRADGEKVEITNDATDAFKLGKVYNSGIFATSNGGVINNYGYIENMVGGNGNITYVTANATSDSNFGKPWNANNKIGTIKLYAADDNISVNNATSEGFIQYEFSAEDGIYVTPAVCKYNYLIVKSDITFNKEAKELKFMEVVNTDKANMVVITNPAGEEYLGLRGFILNGYANVMQNNELITGAAYIRGALYYGGTFETSNSELPATKEVYFGKSEPIGTDNTYLVKY